MNYSFSPLQKKDLSLGPSFTQMLIFMLFQILKISSPPHQLQQTPTATSKLQGIGTHTKKAATWLISSKNWAEDLLITQLDHTDLSFQQEPGEVFVAINTFWVINLHSRELPANSI